MLKNVRFIRQITDYVNSERKIFGDCVYFVLENGNRVKAYCVDTGVKLEVINYKAGTVDGVYLPFSHYFAPVRCSAGAPLWHQHIDGSKWYFGDTYEHVLPKTSDYQNMAVAIEEYIAMYT